MADFGLQAIYDLVKTGNKPAVTAGKDFFDTGVTLITDDPQDGVTSESTQYGIDNAW
jgi:fructose transport system substrate-binding protein